MEMAQTKLIVKRRGRVAPVNATRVVFSAHQCFARDGGADDVRALRVLIEHLSGQRGLAVFIADAGSFLTYILKLFPSFRSLIRCVIVENYSVDGKVDFEGIPLTIPEELPDEVRAVFLCETRAYPCMRMRQALPPCVRVIEPGIVRELALDQLPARAWVACVRDVIYPMALPGFDFQSNLDLLLIDCPARNLGLMPNGLGYVHNALKHVNVRYQTCDVDILLYHRFHIRAPVRRRGHYTPCRRP